MFFHDFKLLAFKILTEKLNKIIRKLLHWNSWPISNLELWNMPTVPCPVGWGSRIHQLLLCKGVRPPANECPWYDTKQSDGEVSAMLELWRMRSTPSLPLLPSPLWPGVVAPDKGPIYGFNRTKPYFFPYSDFCI